MEKGICFGYGIDVVEPHFFYQTVLERPKESFYPSFGLGRIGEDEFDAELFRRSFELRFGIGIFLCGLVIHRVGGKLVGIDV